MAFNAITAFLHRLDELPDRDLLSFVLAGGCNLRCSWCAVRARQERVDEQAHLFEADNYQTLIRGLAQEDLISAVAVVGDEPLLDAAWPMTRAILECAEACELPSAVVTNATKLDERSLELASLQSKVLISLDGTGSYHDQSRRVPGSYEAVIRGFKTLSDLPHLRERITVTSVIQPGKYEYLNELPAVLRTFGIRRWALSPLVQFRRTARARLHPRLFPEIYKELHRLIDEGRAAGLEVMLDDSLSLLAQADCEKHLPGVPVDRPASPNIRVLRMRPDGLTVRFTDLLDTDTSSGLKWDGVEAPSSFYRRLYS